ncbi:hypothetical protein GNI_157550 [Gregarina niphandrodes]|uniref:Uncharacterized protein n=1 Tax=Gregarina niphandrodes TaxID=110365 RepID=A0A023AZU9_GRENI|nr:hypothetical protein GNI_157550 [Gregarina niphandrodes]EZG43830.1 hypothetical protein GNI_157550 [Gregarina niphandrodes]|eukprot:XP_011132985.1 hypothetical protein GNI_157550 [Gregarina niphandrodes]
MPDAEGLLWLPKLEKSSWLKNDPRSPVQLAHRARVQEAIKSEPWDKLHHVTESGFARCTVDYLELAHALSTRVPQPCGVVWNTAVGKAYRPGVTRRPQEMFTQGTIDYDDDVWVSGCLLQYMEAPLTKLADVCVNQLDYKRPPHPGLLGCFRTLYDPYTLPPGAPESFADVLAELHVPISWDEFRASQLLSFSESCRFVQGLRDRGRQLLSCSESCSFVQGLRDRGRLAELPDEAGAGTSARSLAGETPAGETLVHVPFSGWLTPFSQVFKGEAEAHQAIRKLLHDGQWKKIQQMKPADLKTCRMDYLELGRIISLYMDHPFGYFFIDPNTKAVMTRARLAAAGGQTAAGGKPASEALGIDYSSRQCEVWTTGCMLQSAAVSTDALVEFCSKQLGYKPAGNPCQYECLRAVALSPHVHAARLENKATERLATLIESSRWNVSLDEFIVRSSTPQSDNTAFVRWERSRNGIQKPLNKQKGSGWAAARGAIGAGKRIREQGPTENRDDFDIASDSGPDRKRAGDSAPEPESSGKLRLSSKLRSSGKLRWRGRLRPASRGAVAAAPDDESSPDPRARRDQPSFETSSEAGSSDWDLEVPLQLSFEASSEAGSSDWESEAPVNLCPLERLAVLAPPVVNTQWQGALESVSEEWVDPVSPFMDADYGPSELADLVRNLGQDLVSPPACCAEVPVGAGVSVVTVPAASSLSERTPTETQVSAGTQAITGTGTEITDDWFPDPDTSMIAVGQTTGCDWHLEGLTDADLDVLEDIKEAIGDVDFEVTAEEYEALEPCLSQLVELAEMPVKQEDPICIESSDDDDVVCTGRLLPTITGPMITIDVPDDESDDSDEIIFVDSSNPPGQKPSI